METDLQNTRSRMATGSTCLIKQELELTAGWPVPTIPAYLRTN